MMRPSRIIQVLFRESRNPLDQADLTRAESPRPRDNLARTTSPVHCDSLPDQGMMAPTAPGHDIDHDVTIVYIPIGHSHCSFVRYVWRI